MLAPQPLTDIERDMAALLANAPRFTAAVLAPACPTTALDTIDRVCTLASRAGAPLDCEGLTIALRLIKAGATNAEAVLADVRSDLAAATFEAA